MLGGTLALGAGLHRRYGWRISVMAGVAGMLPDWDGLTLVIGGAAYDQSHRIWGHNLLVAAILGGLAGCGEYRANLTDRLRRVAARLSPSPAVNSPHSSAPPTASSVVSWAIWFVTGSVASLSHLVVDLVYSGHPHMQNWGLQLCWPFSRREWAYPIVPWGDVGATLIFVAEMFALYCWPSRAKPIAWLTLVSLVTYVGLRAVL